MRTQRTNQPANQPANQKSETSVHALSPSKGIPNQTRMPKTRNKRGFVRRRAGTFSILVSDLIRHSRKGVSLSNAGFWFLVLLTACADNPQSQQQLSAGKQALQAQQYDPAIRDADAVIAAGDSPDLAEAYYLRGYAIRAPPTPSAISPSPVNPIPTASLTIPPPPSPAVSMPSSATSPSIRTTIPQPCENSMPPILWWMIRKTNP